jgi:hypothetical protein
MAITNFGIVRPNGVRSDHRANRLGNYSSDHELHWQRSDHWFSYLGQPAEEDPHGTKTTS